MLNELLATTELRQRALSRWDNEGGAPEEPPTIEEQAYQYPPLTNAELVHLRIRVIALENLVIALMAQASDRQVEIAREMAAYITPRPGYTQHPLTLKAAEHMTDMLDRAARFQTSSPHSADRLE
ncbi:hypothetical protein [Devosia sp. RR2S18]|uniref:hypothetical protein n=1 Tax=Devosia rhizosphaerae TaxID=3049774 RepID=UPI002541C7DF|nr:hypothetical protein [Devosia sp. RR2S18]WIJ26951.1 hypothetical protein QOV41_09475 [Devosia sp. RR2S18]